MNKYIGSTVTQIFGRQCPEGEVGIEIEVEGQRLPTADDLKHYWAFHNDGSLRGAETAEYVFHRPFRRHTIRKALDYLEKKLADKNSVINDSQRTSVHVHLNVCDLTYTQLHTLFTVYYVFDDLLTEFAGVDRMGNLFCLRGVDAEYVVDQIVHGVETGNTRHFSSDNMRYASMNVTAVAKFGSVEFRTHRGTTDAETIETWANILLCIKDAALGFENPASIISNFSNLGPEEFTKKVFGKYAKHLLGMSNFSSRVWEGVRLAQMIAYASNWQPVAKKETDDNQPRRRRSYQEMLAEVNANLGAGQWGAVAHPAPPPPQPAVQNNWNDDDDDL